MRSQEFWTALIPPTSTRDEASNIMKTDGRTVILETDNIDRRLSNGTVTTSATARSSLSDHTPEATPNVHRRVSQNTISTWNVATLQDHRFSGAANDPSIPDAQFGLPSPSQAYEPAQQHEFSQFHPAIASNVAADGFGPISEQLPTENAMTSGLGAASLPPTCVSLENIIDMPDAYGITLPDGGGTFTQPGLPCAAIGDNPLQGQGPPIPFPYSSTLSGLFPYLNSTVDACGNSVTDGIHPTTAGNDLDLLDYSIAFDRFEWPDSPGQEETLRADEATKAYDSLGTTTSIYAIPYPLSSGAPSFRPVLPVSCDQNEVGRSPEVPVFTNGVGNDVSRLASFSPGLAASQLRADNTGSNVAASVPQDKNGNSGQNLDYNLSSAPDIRVSATREGRSCSLPSSSREGFGATFLDTSNVTGVGVDLPSESTFPSSSAPIAVNEAAETEANQIPIPTAATAAIRRERPATAIGLGVRHSSEASPGLGYGKQRVREKRHMLSRPRKESKLKTRMMRRASEQVAQAAILRIAPKEKAALNPHCSDGADSNCSQKTQNVHAPVLSKDHPVNSMAHCVDGAACGQHIQSICESGGEAAQSSALSYSSESPRIMTRNTPSGPRMYAAISRASRTPLRSPPRPKKVCPYPNCSNVHGFSGDHELRRHVVREHSNRRPVWVLVDISPDRSILRDCRKCQAGKRYNAVYNAAEHLRNHLLGARKGKHQTHAQRTVLPIKKLQPWMKMYEEINIGDGKSALVEVGAKVDQIDGSELTSRQVVEQEAGHQRADEVSSITMHEVAPLAAAPHSSVSSPSLSFSSASSCRSLTSPRTCNLASPAINVSGESNQEFPAVEGSHADLSLMQLRGSDGDHAHGLNCLGSAVDNCGMGVSTDLASSLVEKDDEGRGESASTIHTAAITVSTPDGLSHAWSLNI